MEVIENLFREIEQIDSIDFWEDVMADSYQNYIENECYDMKNDIFDYFICHIDEVDNEKQKTFFIDILSSDIFDTVDNYNKLYDKFENSKDYFVVEKLIDNLRSWSLSKSDRRKLFLLQGKFGNISPLLSSIIQSEQKKICLCKND